MDLLPGETHYCTIAHTASGKIRSDFTVTIVKNGQLSRGTAWNMREVSSTIYAFWFVNDKATPSTWTIVIEEGGVTYLETWQVREDKAADNSQLVRALMPGSFGGSPRNG